MKKLLILSVLVWGTFLSVDARLTLTLDTCRQMALSNNKQLRIAEAKIKLARYQRREAFSAYLPHIDIAGGYLYNSRKISLLDKELQQSLPQIGTVLSQQISSVAANNPELAQYIALLGEIDISSLLNNAGETIVDALSLDTRNIFVGGLSLSQPLYTGGKIRAYNQIARHNEELAESQYNTAAQDIVYRVEVLYWQVISLSYKKELATSYLQLLDTLHRDIEIMHDEGVATHSDVLSVAVRVNEAQVELSRVLDGLCLAKMVLAQVCGMDLDTQYSLIDETAEIETAYRDQRFPIDMNDVFAHRSEIQSLIQVEQIYRNRQRIVMAEMLPSIALSGNYIISNTNIYNGLEKKFKGAFKIGIVLRVPILHWGENLYKYRAAKIDTYISHLTIDDAKDEIRLQVRQATFKIDESRKRLDMCRKNMESANQNLLNAHIGFEEGVIATSNLLEAQTAWVKARTELINAHIDTRMCETYLNKALGLTTYCITTRYPK